MMYFVNDGMKTEIVSFRYDDGNASLGAWYLLDVYTMIINDNVSLFIFWRAI